MTNPCTAHPSRYVVRVSSAKMPSSVRSPYVHVAVVLSYAGRPAAKLDGAEVAVTVATATTHDAVALLDDGDVRGFLEAIHMGDNYYAVDSGVEVF